MPSSWAATCRLSSLIPEPPCSSTMPLARRAAQLALAFAEHLHVTDLVVAHNAGHDRAAEYTETLRHKEARGAKCPLGHECADRAPSEPPKSKRRPLRTCWAWSNCSRSASSAAVACGMNSPRSWGGAMVRASQVVFTLWTLRRTGFSRRKYSALGIV
jgi:hypothetical protein